jgi:hypothetical protein
MNAESSPSSASSSITSVRTELWFAWAEIAGEQEMGAASWRAKAAADLASGRNPSVPMAQETKAAIASIAAAGAALETFGKNLRFFSVDPTKHGSAAERLLSQVRHLYPRATISADLAERVVETFARRNSTLHYASNPEQMGPHPLGMATTWVARTFTVEAARESVGTLADLVSAAVKPGTSPVKEAEWWASYCRNVGKAIRNREKVPLDVVP